MRYLLPFALGAITSPVWMRRPANHKPAKAIPPSHTTGGPTCRRFAEPGDTKIQIYCVSTVATGDGDQPVSA